MAYLLAIFCPPLYFFTRGKVVAGIINGCFYGLGLILIPMTVEAGLILQPGFTDNRLRFDATFSWDGAAGNVSPQFTNWKFDSLSITATSLTNLDNFRHAVNPTDPGPHTLPDPVDLFINFVAFVDAKTVRHPGGPQAHFDSLVLSGSFTLPNPPHSGTIRIEGRHISEPSTILLLAGGLTGLGALAWTRRRRTRFSA